METMLPYSPFHIILVCAGCTLAVVCAFFFSNFPSPGHGPTSKRASGTSMAGEFAGLKRIRLFNHKTVAGTRKKAQADSLLFACGLILAICEMYKQLFLYLVVYQGHYNWWYFPFQLCSIPMYLCLLYPFFPGMQKVFSTFLEDFGLLGGIMALAVPDGLFHPYCLLTLHGFFWHFILIFLGLYCRWKKLGDSSSHGFWQMLPLYLLCCCIASGINFTLQLTGGMDAYTDLFYINCFFPSEQPLFRQISLLFGNIWGHLAYILASCLGAKIIHQLRLPGAAIHKFQ